MTTTTYSIFCKYTYERDSIQIYYIDNSKEEHLRFAEEVDKQGKGELKNLQIEESLVKSILDTETNGLGLVNESFINIEVMTDEILKSLQSI